MSNIDKQAGEGDVSPKTYYIHPAAFGSTQDPGHGHVPVVKADEAEMLRAKLEAAEKRNNQLSEALKQTVSGYKSCLRTGYERILELGGDCDAPEVMIAGNTDIQQAEKLLAAAAGKGE